jgi:hypothetical protein
MDAPDGRRHHKPGGRITTRIVEGLLFGSVAADAQG